VKKHHRIRGSAQSTGAMAYVSGPHSEHVFLRTAALFSKCRLLDFTLHTGKYVVQIGDLALFKHPVVDILGSWSREWV
jgi:hypothetical protein